MRLYYYSGKNLPKMKILFLGDIVGKSGREAVIDAVPNLRRDLQLDCLIVNGENAAHGFGISPTICDNLLNCGVDIVTGGNHSWDKPDIIEYIKQQPRLLRPINMPEQQPGKGYIIYEIADYRILVVNAMGNLFMPANSNDLFAALDRVVPQSSPMEAGFDAVIVDIHAEATSEKNCAGQFLDGRASMVVGTHTHIPTADHRILPNGTAYQSDVGMCGDYHSIIGMSIDTALPRATGAIPFQRLQPAEDAATICGLYIETDIKTGLAQSLHPIRIGANLSNSMKYL